MELQPLVKLVAGSCISSLPTKKAKAMGILEKNPKLETDTQVHSYGAGYQLGSRLMKGPIELNEKSKPVILLRLSLPASSRLFHKRKILPSCAFTFRGQDSKGVTFERQYTPVILGERFVSNISSTTNFRRSSLFSSVNFNYLNLSATARSILAQKVKAAEEALIPPVERLRRLREGTPPRNLRARSDRTRPLAGHRCRSLRRR